MLSIQVSPPSGNPSASKSKTTPTSSAKPLCTPNLLPCRIHRDGPVNASRQHWDPQIGQDGEPIAYFRGRKLKGKEVRVPDGYRGVVVGRKMVEGGDGEAGDKWRRGKFGNDVGGEVQEEEDEDEDEDEEEVVAVLEELAGFEEVVVWDHEKVVEDDDGVVKGMKEWIRFAEAMHASGENKVVKELPRR